MKKILLCCLIATCFLAPQFQHNNLMSQALTTQGTEFWFSFMQNIDPPDELLVFISSDQAANGTIEIPGSGFSQNFNVAANGAVTINIPVAQGHPTGPGLKNTAIHITSDNPVNVFTMSYRPQSTDGALILPVPTLGSSYYTAAFDPYSGLDSEIMLVGIENNTTIDIRPPGGPTQTVTLDRGQAYQYQLQNGDLTGALITSNPHGGRPFAAFSGTRCSEIPSGTVACDHLFEQLQPLRAWRRTFITPPLASRSNGDRYRIIAARNNTQVSVNGAAVATLNSGQFHETVITNASIITANREISVIQYSQGQGVDNTQADPFMIALSPVEQTREDITFFVYAFPSISNNFLNVVTRTACVNSIRLDGADVSAQFATVASAPEYSFAQISVNQGAHRLTSGEDCGFNAYVYGFGNFDSYGYSAGMSLDTLSISAENNANCAGEPVNFFVSSNPYQIIAYDWDFGDGNESTQAAPAHSYQNGGQYQVTLIVTYDNGDKDTVIQNFTITEVNSVFDFTAGGCEIFEATFTDQSTTAEGTINSWQWDFGDGNTSTEQSPNHTYSNTGNYEVTLTVTTSNGCTDTETQEFDIYPYPEAAITADAGGCGIYDASFVDNSTIENGTIVSWLWSFGDGNTSAEQNPAHTYDTHGHYVVELIVTGEGGCSDTATFEFDIFPLPEPVITPQGPTWFCSCDSVELDAGNLGYVEYEWSTGETSQSIVVRDPGDYTVTVTDTNGCSATSPPVTIEVTYPEATINVPQENISHNTGEAVNIPIFLTNTAHLDTCQVFNYTVRLRMNRSLLVPQNIAGNGNIQGNDRIIELTGDRVSGDSILYIMEFIATLGNAVNTPITIESFQWNDCPFETGMNSGMFETANICDSGRISRLFLESAPGVLKISPNPAGGPATISFNSSGEVYSEIYIANIYGKKILTIYKGNLMGGENEFPFSTRGMASGAYFVVVKTPNQVVTKLLEAVK